jgi:hypothetical protein
MQSSADHISPTRWGWIAVACGLEWGEWLDPGRAAQIARTDPATLRRWTERGLVSAIQVEPRAHRRYLKAEMEAITDLTEYASRPSMALLCQVVNDALVVEGLES